MNGESIPTIYDDIPYPNVSHSLSHPDRLATVAALLGMAPAPVEQCRVLELGCAGGGNLIPMACALPNSQFTGVELSARQVAEGEQIIAALELPNITLKQINILDVDAGLGEFDYIIAHGVYSWVPPEVQDKILHICRHNLAANGVAYISYNTYPGWNMLGTLRQMMLYHTRHVNDPRQQAADARALLEFLTRHISTESNTHGGFLYVYANYIKDYFIPKNDAFLLHDELAEINDPVYFYQFAEQAARHELQYLGDVNFSSMLATNLPAEVTQALRQMVKNTVELEQYLDFLRNRMFRQSLVCHKAIQLSARLKPDDLAGFYIASSALPESSEPDIQSVSVEKFESLDGANLSTDHPVTKAAMRYLAEIWPKSVAFNQLLAEARARVNKSAKREPAEDAQILGANLLQAYSRSENLVEFHKYAPNIITQISDYPVVSPMARYMADHGEKLTNLRHERITPDDISLAIIPLLDGTRSREDLITALQAKDMVDISRKDGQAITKPEEISHVLAEIVDKKLNQLARAALLVG